MTANIRVSWRSVVMDNVVQSHKKFQRLDNILQIFV